jgi:hypothetical protein
MTLMPLSVGSVSGLQILWDHQDFLSPPSLLPFSLCCLLSYTSVGGDSYASLLATLFWVNDRGVLKFSSLTLF